MNDDEVVTHLGQRGGPVDHEHADAAAKQIRAALGQRLAGNEPHDLASQLPASSTTRCCARPIRATSATIWTRSCVASPTVTAAAATPSKP